MTERLPIDLNAYATEEDLLVGLRSQEGHACACLLKRYAAPVFSLGLRMMNDQDEAEEVMQETFISACKHIGSFEGRSKLSTWLYRIAANAALMRLRKQKPTVSLDSLLDDPASLSRPQTIVSWRPDLAETAMQDDLRQALESALNSLNDGLRATFVLRDIQGFSTAETAAALDISESAAKVRLHRARLQLREILSRDPRIALEEYGITPAQE